MTSIRVVVHGALGKVGQEVVRAVYREPEMQLVGAVDLKATQDSLVLPAPRNPWPARIHGTVWLHLDQSPSSKPSAKRNGTCEKQ